MNERDYTEEQRLEAEEAYREDYVTRDEGLGGKSPEDLEAEIEQIRRELDATLRQIERKFSPAEMFDRAWHYVQGGPSDYAASLNSAVKTNPIPAALMGISLGWLMLSTEAARREWRGGGLEHGRDRGAEAAGRIRSKAQQMSHRVSETMHRASETMHRTSDKLHGAADAARSKSREWAGEGREAGSRISGAVHDWGETAHGAREGIEHGAHRYAERARQTRGTLSEAIHEQPLLLGVLGAAAGAFLGAMLPQSRREEELFAEPGARMRRKVRETGSEQMQKAAHVAGTAAEAAKEEGERQLH